MQNQLISIITTQDRQIDLVAGEYLLQVAVEKIQEIL